MRVLITGGTGYLGSALCRRLSASGHQITLVARKSSSFDLIDSVRELLDFVFLDSESFEADLLAIQPPFDVCIHCATRYGKGSETESDVKVANLDFPICMFQLAAKAGVKNFVNIDTPIPANVSAYARFKSEFREYFQEQDILARRINVVLQYFYGESEPAGRLVSSLTSAALSADAPFEMSPGEQRRDFIHIDDVLSGFEALLLKLTELPKGYTSYDLGSGEAVSLRELVGLIQSAHPESSTEFRFGAFPYRDNEPMKVVAEIASIQRDLEWAPSISLEEGIARVLSWRKGEGSRCDF